ncbi:MAG TPA: hypothetical protein PKE55_05835, partial [Kiritimatiellia bacterium]|nr:hypothetical protein [Kiritimatiellia bacterium]
MNKTDSIRRRAWHWGLVFMVSGVYAGSPASFFEDGDRQAIVEALDVLNMEASDLGFAKDVGEPQWALPVTRSILHTPLDLVAVGERLFEVGFDPTQEAWESLFVSYFPASAGYGVDDAGRSFGIPEFPDGFKEPLAAFYREAQRAAAMLGGAWRDLDLQSRRVWAARTLAGWLDVEVDQQAWKGLVESGVDEEILKAWKSGLDELDPEPMALEFVKGLKAIDITGVIRGGGVLHRAALELEAWALTHTEWPESVLVVETELGKILIGTEGADHYKDEVLLILDPGGDDVYSGRAGVAKGVESPVLSVILDLGGNDRLVGGAGLGPGTAVWGAS